MAREHAIIIGGSSGIGLATAQQLAGSGYDVTIASRDATRLQTALDTLPSGTDGLQLDGSDADQIKGFFGSVRPFNHLVLALTGNKGAGPFAEIDMDEALAGFAQKTVPQLRCAQAALGHIDPKGSLTFVSAASAQAAFPGVAGLAAINGALLAAVPPLAVELKPLRVNAVTPGVIDTPWWDIFPADQRQQAFAMFAGQSLAGRIGTAEDVASVIAMLIGNSFVTGEIISCDGGLRFGQS